MRNLPILLSLFFLLFAADCFAIEVQPLTVSGSNDPVVNGTYLYDGFFDSRVSWAKGDIKILWGPSVMANGWAIIDMTTFAHYYDHPVDTPSPSETEWQCSYNFLPPCTPPVVTSSPLPETLLVSGTADSFLNGTYRRGLNFNGYPRYAMGNYEIRQGTDFLTLDWNIQNTNPAHQYYTHTGIGANVPEQDWAPGFSASTPLHPPVVSEKRLPNRYKVSGAGSQQVNGMYLRTTNSIFGPVYQKIPLFTLEAGGFGGMDFGYGITESGIDKYYYTPVDASLTPLVIPSTDWTLDALGVADPPSVTPYEFPWQMFLPTAPPDTLP